MTHEEALLIDIKFQLDMYGSGQGSAEDTLARVREIIFSPSLTDDQQVVLEWLKQYTLDDSDFKNTICELSKLHIAGVPYKKEEIAFKKLNDSELAQVLAAFAEWGNKSNE